VKHSIIDNRTEINRLKAENARLEAKVNEFKEEVTHQKQKAQEMVEFICECVAKGEFKAFKNGSVKFGKTKKGEKR
jgi:predicted nuclease with TOPRIM domain